MSCVVIACKSFVSFGSSIALDSTLGIKATTYGAKYDAQQEVAWLCTES